VITHHWVEILLQYHHNLSWHFEFNANGQFNRADKTWPDAVEQWK